MSKKDFFGVVPDLKRKAGFLKYKTCTLVIHRSELIIAHSTKALRNTFKDMPPEDHYLPMPIEAILEECPDNFSISPEDIIRIRLIPGEGGVKEEERGPDKIAIRTHEQKHLFLFGPLSKSVAHVRKFFKQDYADLLA